MANTLRFKRGLVSTIPTALAGEPLFTTDTFDLYIGNGTTNTRFQKYIASGTTSQLLRGDGSLLTMPIVLTSPANGQVLKFNGTNWVNDSDAGITGSGTTNYLPKFTGASTLGNSNFVTDATGNLGIGTGPSSWNLIHSIEIGTIGNSVAGFIGDAGTYLTSNAYYNSGWKYATSSKLSTLYSMEAGTHVWRYAAAGTANGAITFTQAARITSGGNFIINNPSTDNGLRFQVTGDGFFSGSVGIGVSPAAKLDILATASDDIIALRYPTLGKVAGVYLDSANVYYGAGANNFTNAFVAGHTTNVLTLRTAGTIRATLDANGNLGLGVVPSAWSGYQALQIGGAGGLSIFGYNFAAEFGNNYYYNAGYKYGATSFATNYVQGSGEHRWFNAPSGSANAAITFTQAMTLDASGRLGIGTANPTQRLHVIGNIMVSPDSNFIFDNLDNGNNGAIVWRNADGSRTMSAQITSISDGSFARKGIGFFTKDVADWTTPATQKMLLNASGNLGLGVVPSAWSLASLSAMQIQNGGFYGYSVNEVGVTSNSYYNAGWKYINSSFATQYSTFNGAHRWYNAPSGTAGAAITFTQAMTLDASGRLLLGSGSVTSELLQVNGTMRVSGASTFGSNVSIGATSASYRLDVVGSGIRTAPTAGATGLWGSFVIGSSFDSTNQYFDAFRITGSGGSGYANSNNNVLFQVWNGTAWSTQLTLNQGTGAATFSSSVTANGFTSINNTGGGLFTSQLRLQNSTSSQTLISFENSLNGYAFGLNTTGTQRFVFINGGLSEIASISGTGAATFSSSGQFGGNLTVSSASGTQSTFQDTFGGYRNTIILRNTADTVIGRGTGIAFQSGASVQKAYIGITANDTIQSSYDLVLGSSGGTLTIANAGTSTFSSSARAVGFITSGGTGYAVINSASNTVTALRPTGGGTNIMSTNSNGLHIAVGTEAAGDLILATNNTERIRLSSDGFFSQGNGTNPTSSIADRYIQYSADIVAGNAAPHFRTENGAVIKLYQQDNSIAAANFVAGIGTSVTTLDAFDGYTIGQVVKALRNAGILS